MFVPKSDYFTPRHVSELGIRMKLRKGDRGRRFGLHQSVRNGLSDDKKQAKKGKLLEGSRGLGAREKGVYDFWTVGRLYPGDTEVYVCHDASASDEAVEKAFQINLAMNGDKHLH